LKEDKVSDPILSSDAASLSYFDGDRTTYALREASVEIPAREFVGIMGPSGSGKSSLLYVLSGLKRPTSGDVSFRGAAYGKMSEKALTELRRSSFGFVFQQPWLLGWQTATENVLMGAPEVDQQSIDLAEQSLKRLGIYELRDKIPSQLSGGEKQRICVARAMMNEPSVIFADEPTASLDQRNGHLVVDLLSDYKSQGTVVIVTHDAGMLTKADRVLVMRDGATVEWVTPAEAAAGRSYSINTQP
jgi:putative ABC transport system ATP-binding protein